MSRSAIACALLALPWALACASPAPGPAEQAERYAEAGLLEQATAEIERVVREHPDDPQLRRQAAAICARAGDLSRSVEHLESGIASAPNDAELWLDLAELERRRNNVEDAYLAYRRAAELAPDDVRAVSGLALTADMLGFDAEADAAYERWTELERLGRPAR